ncbi:hypothetical protein [Falsirhodobacter sp. 20TX0035]|uniref:hypothetical protein n=1 Tax=Falsirhodobacter sp. 20TX0035 TaxID=3022019 RepID=UPI00232CE442|nr:hypothetical protein [Falsirhodobacter sp. 20TX0035]MDB6453000.1 hypothetical protein [Falsirhodobacter sp. 20TX0035]
MSEDITIPPMREDGLQLDEHRRMQRVFWTVQRISWVIFGIVCLVAVLGFTGSGGVFQKQTVQVGDAEVELPRVARWEGSDTMTVRFAAEASPELVLSQPFFERFSMERIQPEPQEAVLAPAAQRLRFHAEGAPPYQLSVGIRPMHFGWAHFDVTIGGETRMVNVLVLP